MAKVITSKYQSIHRLRNNNDRYIVTVHAKQYVNDQKVDTATINPNVSQKLSPE